MREIKAWAVITKFSEMRDVIAESSTGVYIPFFSAKSEAEEWRRYKNNTATTEIVQVKLKEIKAK